MSHISVNDLISNKEPFKYKCLQIINSLDFCQRVQARANNPCKINQCDAPLCGPAAFLYCIAKLKPELYIQYIYHLALNGTATIGSMKIKPSEACKNADISAATIDPIDWIGLASLRDATNSLLPMTSVSDNLAGITLPVVLNDWFARTRLFGQIINKTNHVFTKAFSNLVDANRYYRNGYKVCLFINTNMLFKPSSSTLRNFSKGLPTPENIKNKIKKTEANLPNHWVVLDDNMMLGNQFFSGDIKIMEEKKTISYQFHLKYIVGEDFILLHWIGM